MIYRPSVTQVIGRWADFSKVTPDVLQAASERGTRVHRICGAKVQGLFVPAVPEDIAGYVESFDRWLELARRYMGLAPIRVEEELVSPFGFVGHPDLIARIDGRLAVIDWKTPAAASKLWRLQLAAYTHLARENGLQVERAGALRLVKDGNIAKLDWYDGTVEQDMAVFLSMLNVERFLETA